MATRERVLLYVSLRPLTLSGHSLYNAAIYLNPRSWNSHAPRLFLNSPPEWPACENIFLAALLKEYMTASGRQKIINGIAGQVNDNLASQFKHHMGILSYWRDTASHGIETGMSEPQAHEAIGRLIRLCNFIRDNWSALVQTLNRHKPESENK